MASKSYTLLEYLVTLEKQIKELQVNGGSGGSGSNNTELINYINQVQQELNTFKNSINNTVDNNNTNLLSKINELTSELNNLKSIVNNLNMTTRTEYFYVAKDNNTYNLFSDSQIKVYDDFNNFLLKENENYKRNGTTLTFNYINPLKIRIEYDERVVE